MAEPSSSGMRRATESSRRPTQRPLRVYIDARVMPGSGGVQQFILGLASGLSGLEDGDEQYVFVTYEEYQDWLRPYLAGPCRLELTEFFSGRRRVKEALLGLRPVRATWDRWSPVIGRRFVRVPRSDPVVEQIDPDVVHMTTQYGAQLDRPTIYHPHDLQHLHYPSLFTPHQRLKREVFYRTLCHHADVVAVWSSFTRDDIVGSYGVPAERVRVIPLAPPVALYDEAIESDSAETLLRLGLPERFGFYPAQTWPHKNHIVLLEAIHLIRQQQGVVIPMVFTGRLTDFFAEIERRAEQLGISDQLTFLGFVGDTEIRQIYDHSSFVVIPSKFESASFPLWEAFATGTPAACSRVACFAELVGDAALQFDPDAPDELAEVIQRLWEDRELRRSLAESGLRRVAPFRWERTARTFRAHYRSLAGRDLTSEDRRLIEEPPAL